MMDTSALQRYIQKQRLGSPDGGMSGVPRGPGGPLDAGGRLAVPQGPGIADYYSNDDDDESTDLDEFGRSRRPYMGV